LIKPPRLAPGDWIGLAAPASAPPDPQAIDLAVASLQRLGFRPRLARHVRARHGYLAGTDSQRASDLMQLFADPKVRAILCIRGGYGCVRILDRLDYTFIRRHPRILVGYSDVTSLHAALLRHSGLVTFHGPMMNSDFNKEDMPAFSLDSFRRVLMATEPSGSVCQGYRGSTVQILQPGRAEGRLVGGNLSLLCAAVGTPYQPSLRGAILFLEDLDETPYRFDRLLTQLLLSGALRGVKGIAIGINANCDDPRRKGSKEYRQSLEDVLVERLGPLGLPMVMGLPFGHVPHNATLPVGVRARLDAHAGDLEILESAVT
jgi:muramoyltetrapeptide carboxypeptidase